MINLSDEELSKIMDAMHRALLEIRASKNLDGAQLLADIFHKVPKQIISGRTYEEVRHDILMRSDRHRVRHHVENWFR